MPAAALAKPSAATSKAEPSGSKRAATTERPAANTKKTKYKDGELKSQCYQYFRRLASGQAKKANEEEVQQASQAMATYDQLQESDKVQFAKAFYSSKGTKSFGFIKDYSEKVMASKTVVESFEENYFTRTTGDNASSYC